MISIDTYISIYTYTHMYTGPAYIHIYIYIYINTIVFIYVYILTPPRDTPYRPKCPASAHMPEGCSIALLVADPAPLHSLFTNSNLTLANYNEKKIEFVPE